MNKKEPKTLREAIVYFSDPANCREYLVSRRWPNGVACPTCDSKNVKFSEKYNRWQCGSHHDRRQFTLKTGTIFEDSPLGLDKWLPAMWLIVNCKNGVSSYEIHRAIGVTQKTAWFMLHRIRLAMQTETYGKVGGEVEIDETYIGGAARFMHKDKKKRVLQGRKGGQIGKVAVTGLLERKSPEKDSHVRVCVVENARRNTLMEKVKGTVEPGSEVFTDQLASYFYLSETYIHGVIDHGEAYVNGKIHTNGLENFWSLLKRSIKGTYVSVEPFHLFRYLDEQAYRFNNRKTDDRERFSMAIKAILGKRIEYKVLTGKDQEETC